MQVPFLKVHGAGNDFIVLDGRGDVSWLTPSEIRRLCNRNFGIGADGILLLAGFECDAPRMKIYNADASVAEMCGNGIRCFAKAMRDHHGVQHNPMDIYTDAGVKTCQIDERDGLTQVSVRMGDVTREDGSPLEMGLTPDSLELDGEKVVFYPLATGNPHAVVFGASSEAFMAKAGPFLTRHPRFAQGTNTEFANVIARDQIELAVHERGVGFTLACGTGSVATVAAAVSAGLCDPDVPVSVQLPGGTLRITVPATFQDTIMQGPAEETFAGEVTVQTRTVSI